MSANVRIEQRSPVPILTERHRVQMADLPRIIPETIDRFRASLGKLGVALGRDVVIYHDMEMNIEIGVEVDSIPADNAGLTPSSTPGGRVAVLTHVGPYHLIPQAHQALHNWAKSTNTSLVGVCWEIYVEPTPNPADFRTDIVYMLQ